MDGIDLVFDDTTLPGQRPKPGSASAPSPVFRRSAILSLLAVVLGVIGLAVGYALLERAISQNNEAAPLTNAPVNQPISQETTPARRPTKLAPLTDDSSEKVAATAAITTAAATARKPQATARDNHTSSAVTTSKQRLRLPVLPRAAVQTKTTKTFLIAPQPQTARAHVDARSTNARLQTTSPRKDSKFVSIVKKTGRIIAKPFKL
jgi:cytoskeletal protein RodZ